MADSENTGFVPRIGLDANTLQAVRDAGVDAQFKDNKGRTQSVRDTLGKIKIRESRTKAAVEAVQKVKGIGDARREKLEKWDEGFDDMELRGAWGNDNLYDEFAKIEAENRAEYEKAVKRGNKKKQGQLLQNQAERSNQLKAFKSAMDAAKKINDTIGWSVALKGDDESREVLMEMSKMGPDVAATADFDENGILTFEINGKRYNATEIDKMVAEGTKPVQKELDYLKGLQNYQTMGAEGKPFNDELVTKQNMLALGNDDDLATYAFEDFGGGGSFAQHIATTPEMLKAFEGLTYNTDMDSEVLQAAMEDGTITADEYATFSDDDMKKIIGQMPADDLRKSLANYQMLQQKKNWQTGVDAKQNQNQALSRAATYRAMNAEDQQAFKVSFLAQPGNTEFDFYKMIYNLEE